MLNNIDTTFSAFLASIIQETIENSLSRIQILNDEVLKDIILAECMERIAYDEIKNDVQCICAEVIDKESVKLINHINEHKR